MLSPVCALELGSHGVTYFHIESFWGIQNMAMTFPHALTRCRILDSFISLSIERRYRQAYQNLRPGMFFARYTNGSAMRLNDFL